MNLNYFWVFIGGGLGSVFRAILVKMLPQSILGLPLQIFFINVLGCFLMGTLFGLTLEKWNPNSLIRLFLTTGFLGGFTTFSAFSLDFGNLVQKKLYSLACIYVLGTVFLSLIFFLVGTRIFK